MPILSLHAIPTLLSVLVGLLLSLVVFGFARGSNHKVGIAPIETTDDVLVACWRWPHLLLARS